ncbi:unnamed protein product [Peniophora sp. CBMAI 1063]|nr:unnamed protein product [Peniophora sp. CBMAI 1063]
MPNFPTLSSVIESVCDLIHDLPASVAKNPPKTRTIPTTTIEKLRTLGRELSRTLAETDITPLLAPAPSELSAIKAQLDELTHKVDNITTLPIPIRTSGQEPPRPATASASPHDNHVTAPSAQRRDASLDIVVTPKVASPPTLLEEAPKSILKRLNDRIRRHRTLKDLCQLEDGFTAPVFRAVMPQADGSLRLLVCTQTQRCVLVAQTDSWLKQCLPTHQFSYGPRPRGHTVVVHGVPTSAFNPRESKDEERLLAQNAHALNPDTLLNIHWLSHQPLEALRAAKSHSSLVFHVTSPDIAEQLVASRISIDGALLRTEHIVLRPSKCFNCFRIGHIAAHCHYPSACGICAGPHRTLEGCPCSRNSEPCTDLDKCTHKRLKCATPGCAGQHHAMDPRCPMTI